MAKEKLTEQQYEEFDYITDFYLPIKEVEDKYNSPHLKRLRDAKIDSYEYLGLEKVEGRTEIVKKWEEAMENYEYIVFTALLGSLNIEGNTASGTTYTIEVSTDINGKKSQIHGQYLDEFTKRENKWFFQKRTFSILHD